MAMLELRRVFLGRRLASDETHHTQVNNFVGLAVFSSDALSSVAYATQEIMASLSSNLPAGMAAVSMTAAGMMVHPLFGLSIPVSMGIVGLLIVLGIGYRQTIMAYPGGGGAYIVAKDNLGELAAQTAGAALLTDYILTVAASVSSGVQNIVSAIPALEGHNVVITIACILFICMANLRGVKESGAFFAVPTYGFIALMMLMLATGTMRVFFGGGPGPTQVQQAVHQAGQFSAFALIWIFMRAYSAGCTALTGVEAISNGITAFREPSSHNAAKTMTWMILLLGTMFLGISILSSRLGVVYAHSEDSSQVAEALLSQLVKHVYGITNLATSPLSAKLVYYLSQGFTFAILVVAANTAYADFPRLAALHAGDGFLPSQFVSRGDRLVFSNGVIFLTVISCFLVWVCHANPDRLLPLYALGVFLGFTISQTGMVVHWMKLRGTSSKVHLKAVVNGLGALAAGIVMVDIAVTKFIHGAWIIVVLIPTMVTIFFGIHRHYVGLKAKLAASRTVAALPTKHHTIVLVSSLHAGLVQALSYSRLISGGRVEALTVDLGSDGIHDSPAMEKMRRDWKLYGMDIPLRSLPSPYRGVIEPIMEEIDRFQKVEPEVCLTVILPEFVTTKWWHRFLHNQMAFWIKAQLINRPGVIVTTVRMHLPGI
jgi:amino acid transporter